MLGVLLIVLLSPVIVVLATSTGRTPACGCSRRPACSAGRRSAPRSRPRRCRRGRLGTAILKLGVAVLTLGAVWFGWQSLVARMLVTPGREASAKSYRGLGWFDRMPHGHGCGRGAQPHLLVPRRTVLGVDHHGADRADPRGRAARIAGIPLSYTALIPVPLMCLLLGWSLHNDTAYDSTAVWLHVVSSVRGSADRAGRLVPVLIAGVLVIGLGSAVTVFVLDDWRLLPSIVG